MDVCLLSVVELAGAFQNNIAAGPIQRFRIIGRHHINRAAPKVERFIFDGHRAAKAAMDAVVFQQVSVCLNRACCVDTYDLDVVARSLGDMC